MGFFDMFRSRETLARRREDHAYSALKADYEAKGLVTWPVSSKLVPYRMGVSLDWPNEPDAVVQKQIEDIHAGVNVVAAEYGLEALVEGPSWAAGGAQVMYVGFGQKS